MKKWVVFILGLISGCILTVLSLVAIIFVASAINKNEETTKKETTNLVLFDEPGEEFSAPSFKIDKVLSNNKALASSGEKGYSKVYYSGIEILLIGDENTHFYNDQIIEIEKGKAAYIVGTYKYDEFNTGRHFKTVPVIKILDK